MGQDLIKRDEIFQILEAYCIGKKPLAKLLGWGETTILRYLEGDTPTPEYSQKLMILYQDPLVYYELLMDNKEQLTGVAFRKSKEAVLSKLLSSKLHIITQYLINQAKGEISPISIQAILFYSQLSSLVLWEKELFAEECRINIKGIPYPEIYEEMQQRCQVMLELKQNLLSQEEMELLDTIADAFAWYGPKAIKTLLKAEQARFLVRQRPHQRLMVRKDTLKMFYKELFRQNAVARPRDFTGYLGKRMNALKNQ